MNEIDFDLDPTDDDLATVEPVTDSDDFDEWDDDFSYSATDDRYEGSGIPKWSAWA
jgi:hypothetical protein